MILDDILKYKREEAERLKKYTPASFLQKKIDSLKKPRDFAYSISQKGGPDAIRIIAEVKKASPSKGVLKAAFYPFEIAKVYQVCGAAALSVVTEEKFFQGRLEYLTPIKNYLKLPVLRKDFIIDEIQVYDTAAAGADAILLIAAILDRDRLKSLYDLSVSFGMQPVVEVHCAEELKVAVDMGAKVVGINNRDLKTFETRLQTTLDLMPGVPKDVIAVAESGIATRGDILLLKQAGVSAFLIGEALMKEENIGKKLRELLGAES